MKKIFLTALILLTGFISYGQIPKTIEIDPITDIAKESLPFDQTFLLKKTYDEKPNIIGIGYFEISANQLKNPRKYWNEPEMVLPNLEHRVFENKDKKYELYITVTPLEPQLFYEFFVLFYYKPDNPLIAKYISLFDNLHSSDIANANVVLNEINKIKRLNKNPFEHIDFSSGKADLSKLENFFNSKLKLIYDDNSFSKTEKKEKVIAEIIKSDVFIEYFRFNATSEIFSFETRAKFKITPDFGYVGYGFQKDFNGITPYLGFQIEFRYFDKNIPFKLIPNKTIWRRLSFNSGITLASMKRENQREDFFSNRSLMMGFGFRISSAVRITTGTILFNREDPNPLVDNKKLGVTPFIGLSIDLSLKQLFNDISGLIPLNRN